MPTYSKRSRSPIISICADSVAVRPDMQPGIAFHQRSAAGRLLPPSDRRREIVDAEKWGVQAAGNPQTRRRRPETLHPTQTLWPRAASPGKSAPGGVRSPFRRCRCPAAGGAPPRPPPAVLPAPAAASLAPGRASGASRWRSGRLPQVKLVRGRRRHPRCGPANSSSASASVRSSTGRERRANDPAQQRQERL
jgi:hypothetical protein